MPIHGSLFQEYQENPSSDPFVLQNKKMLKISMQYGPVWAKTGAMVAYQGDVRFENTGSGGLDKLLKSKLTGEGVKVMRCTGSGELFVADLASEIQLFYLENDMVSVNGNNVLAFSSSIEWDIHRVQARGAMMAGGLFNVSLRGTGYVAVTTKGDPVALDVGRLPDVRRRPGGRPVDQWRVDGHPGRHRRPEVARPRRDRRDAPDGLRRARVRPRPAVRECRGRRYADTATQRRGVGRPARRVVLDDRVLDLGDPPEQAVDERGRPVG